MFIVDKYLYARCWDTAVNRTNTICTAPNLTDSWVNTQGHLRKSEGVPGKNKYPHQGLNWLSIYFVQDRVPLGVRSRTSCQSGSLAVSEVQTRGRHDWCWELRIISSQEDGSPEDGSLEGNTGLYKHNDLELNFKSDEQNQKPGSPMDRSRMQGQETEVCLRSRNGHTCSCLESGSTQGTIVLPFAGQCEHCSLHVWEPNLPDLPDRGIRYMYSHFSPITPGCQITSVTPKSSA